MTTCQTCKRTLEDHEVYNGECSWCDHERRQGRLPGPIEEDPEDDSSGCSRYDQEYVRDFNRQLSLSLCG